MPDCGSNSCLYRVKPSGGGQRTNSMCTCDECEHCGARIRPGYPGTHRSYCENKDFVPAHHLKDVLDTK